MEWVSEVTSELRWARKLVPVMGRVSLAPVTEGG